MSIPGSQQQDYPAPSRVVRAGRHISGALSMDTLRKGDQGPQVTPWVWSRVDTLLGFGHVP
jgi:hypothetical protein